MRLDLKLTDKFEVRGVWFLADKPETQVPGILTFLPEEGGRLELEGGFGDFRTDATGPPPSPPIILGRTRDFDNVTLYQCIRTSVSWKFPPSAVSQSVFYVKTIFFGAHFAEPQSVIFDRFHVRYSHLDHWLNLDTQRVRREDNKTVVSIEDPEPIPFLSTEDYKAEVRFRNQVEPSRTEIRALQYAYVTLISSRPRHFGEFLEFVYYLQNFLALGVGDRVYPVQVRGVGPSDRVASVLYSFPWLPSTQREIRPYDMVFTYHDAPGRLPALLDQWVTRSEVLRPVYESYFGNLYHPAMYIEQRFLSLIQALESYHRLARPGYELPPEQHHRRIAEILASAPQAHRKWLERKLDHSNEVTLRVRIQQLADEMSDLFQPPRRNEFVEKVVTTRHYMTHFSPELKPRVASDDELVAIVQKLKFLLTLFLLKETGFSRDDVLAFVDRNPRLKEEVASAWWE